MIIRVVIVIIFRRYHRSRQYLVEAVKVKCDNISNIHAFGAHIEKTEIMTESSRQGKTVQNKIDKN